MRKIMDIVSEEERRQLVDRALSMAMDLTEEDFLEAEKMPSEEILSFYHKFTPEFEAKMDALFAEARAREAEKRRRKKLRVLRNGLVAVACLVMVIGVGAVQSIQSNAVFGIEMESFQEIYDQFVSVTWGSNEKEAASVVVREPELNILPTGYVETTRAVSNTSYLIVYKNAGQNDIVISGKTVLSATLQQEDIDTENHFDTTVLIDETTCRILQIAENEYMIKWEADGNIYSITAPISQQQLVTIAKSMIVQ